MTASIQYYNILVRESTKALLANEAMILIKPTPLYIFGFRVMKCQHIPNYLCALSHVIITSNSTDTGSVFIFKPMHLLARRCYLRVS